jgi:hypothetical protein
MLGANVVVLALFGQAANPARDPAALVEKLGSSSRVEHEAAKSLEGLGSKALPALRASLKSKDPEVRTRAGEASHSPPIFCKVWRGEA